MPDEQTTLEHRGDAGSEEAPNVDSGSGASTGWRAALSGRSFEWWLVRFVLVVLVLIIGGYGCLLYVNLNPDIGPDGFQVRRVASTASKHLSSSPDVISAETTDASADLSGNNVRLDVRLKDNTSPDTAANLLASTWQKTLQEEPDYSGEFIISVSWNAKGTTIDIDVYSQRDPEAIRTDVKRALTPVGEAKTFTGKIDEYQGPTIDYGDVTTTPTTLTQPGMKKSSKTFTMNGWTVTSTSNTDGQFPTTVSFEQVITTAKQAGPTGTIELSNGTLSVTGPATDERKGLTPEAAAPVVHTVADCQAAGLNTLKLNDEAKKEPSSDDLWITFVCNNGTWASRFDSPSPSDTEILNKAAEL